MGMYKGIESAVFVGPQQLLSETSAPYGISGIEQTFRAVIDKSLEKAGAKHYSELTNAQKSDIKLNIAFTSALSNKDWKLASVEGDNIGFDNVEKLSIKFVEDHKSKQAISALMRGIDGLDIEKVIKVIESDPAEATKVLDLVGGLHQHSVEDLNGILNRGFEDVYDSLGS